MERPLNFASEESIKYLHEWKSWCAHYETVCNEEIAKDQELTDMVLLLDETRLNWRKSDMENARLKSTNDSLDSENKKVNAELDTTRDKLRESQAQIAALLSTVQSLDREIVEYKKRLNVVKSILRQQNSEDAVNLNGYISDNPMDQLMELPFLKNETTDLSSDSPPSANQDSHANAEEIDYDKTGDTFGEGPVSDDDSVSEEQLYSQPRNRTGARKRYARHERRQIKRRSISQQPSSLVSTTTTTTSIMGKRTVQRIEEECVPTQSEHTPPKRSKGDAGDKFYEKRKPLIQNTPKRSSLRRSISEASLLNPKTPMLDRLYTGSTLQMRSPMIGFGNMWTRGRPIADCTHTFKLEKFNLLGICAVCLKGFSNSCYRCYRCNDCKCTVHESCKMSAPSPCVPAVKTPLRNQKHRPRLADFCPESRPKIPALIVRCVVALEKGYLNTVGLYRVPGSEGEVKKLLDAFNSSIPPNLTSRDPEVICGCIKRFLRELREPLIPTSSYDEFIQTVEENNRDQLMSVVAELPIPNRDTLAFLCSHWQNVAHNSNANQMPIENLATCLGPTIVGSSSRFGCLQSNARADQHSETRRQNDVLLHLLRLDQSYWTNILTGPVVTVGLGSTASRTTTALMRHPLRELNADKSFLGPVIKTPSRDALIQQVSCKTTPGRKACLGRLY